MKIGIIIIFHNNETDIDKSFFIDQIKSSEHIEICFVDNESKDETLNHLDDIKEVCPDKVSVIEIKRNVSEIAATKAGARYMFNEFNLKHIGYVNANALKRNGLILSTLIKRFCTHKDVIIDFNLKIIKDQEIKKTLFKSVFSVVEYLQHIEKSSLVIPTT
ncbi:glycosyltransferase [Winogradskyella undariae]|uniref:glycosyltransferase n=1 Tax=Winogradskyella TaxID=286104 RepID=UPI00156AD8B0|nr:MULTISPECIES: glycosyltransferase [Winogradskyella]NRR90111.1 glycosyltransferase [Winogradskyella undariae]QNK76531.1 glycosyltransferase [Winogradskyella sp. PAMC22761]QXP77517.1 glycosyltransferase [Winogradskyella sp. HaHa_3_26]